MVVGGSHFQIADHGHFIAAGKQPAAHTILKHLVGQFHLVHFVELALHEKSGHPCEGVDPGDIQPFRLAQHRLQTTEQAETAILDSSNTNPVKYPKNVVHPTVEFMKHVRQLNNIWNIKEEDNTLHDENGKEMTALFLIKTYFEARVLRPTK